jgi:four helix bundle protein
VLIWQKHGEKRRYEAAFIAKLSDSEAEAAEAQTWVEFAVKCNYLTLPRQADAVTGDS